MCTIPRHLPLLALLLLPACGDDGAGPGGDDGAPVIEYFITNADHDLLYDQTLTATDPDGDPVSIRVSTLPSWLTFDSASARLSGVPGEDAIGQHPITVRASDGESSTVERDTIYVKVGTSNLVLSGPWISQTPHRFFHDGEPVATDRFMVYNDFSAEGTKEAMGEMLEPILDTLLARLGVVSEDELEYPPDGHLHVYVDKLQGDAALGYSSTVNGWAFRDGLIVMAPDAPRRTRQGYSDARYRGLVTHELTHDVEFLLIGRDAQLHSTDAWFREGIATYMAGLAPGGVPVESATRATMAQWRAAHAHIEGGGNPIGIHTFSFPPGVTNTGSYYFWFAQAIRYLVDDEGFGLGEPGLRGFYDDARAGVAFATAFEERTGTSLADFEAGFWERMEEFLPEG